MSALSRMAASTHRQLDIIPGDLVVISATPIPGNEKTVSRVINQLFRKGANVIYNSLAEIHVSGHACQEELKLMYNLVKPKFFMPVHGEYRHLKQHANLLQTMGIPKENTFVMDIGNVLELNNQSAKITRNVTSGNILVDGLGVGDVGNIVLRDRKLLSKDGLVVVIIALEKETGTITTEPDIISRGFVYVRESEQLIEQMRKVAVEALAKYDGKEWATIKMIVKDALKEYLYANIKRNPMIIPIVIEI
jgi:ribonuclease J